MNKIEKVRCSERVKGVQCKGATFNMPVSRMEASFGHVKYKCDKCGALTKTVFESKEV